VTINMISMFAFIVALGIVVDDAIVAGENIYEYRQRGMGAIEAAIRGARDVAVPVTFSILTNIAAFTPMFFVPGILGKVWGVIPAVVCTVFAISLVEALFILPAHLAHTKSKPRSGFTQFLHERQQAFSRLVRRFIHQVYGPFLDFCIRYRTVTLATGTAVLVLAVAYVASGRIGVILMPRVEADYAVATAMLPYGSPLSRAIEVRDQMIDAANRVIDANGGDRLSEGIFALIRENEVELTVYLTDPEVRPVPTAELTDLWRQELGLIPGLESIKFESDRGGPGSGAAITVELNHRSIEVLDRAGAALAERLEEFAVVRDIDDGFTPGKQQLDFRITPEGESLGLSAAYLAREVRNSFEGSKAIRQQRGRNEITVRVRRPRSERVSEYDLERMIVRTPRGGEVPLMDVAEVSRGRAYTVINRRKGRRTVTVTADVVPISETSRVLTTLREDILPELVETFSGLDYNFEGRQADFSESLDSLFAGLLLALLCIYAMLAIPFGSYWQPAVVMMAIPFGIVGAVLGHIIMGYAISILSLMGIVALSGVVVNDSLVLIDYANRLRRERGYSPFQAIHEAGVRRFRPILLTTLTTFGGLAPMIFETSRQARFLIPMALSLGYGILFATAITLVIVPCLYLLLNDVGRLFQRLPVVGSQSETSQEMASQQV
jgi:multidrug efflux pump subunit AcrB